MSNSIEITKLKVMSILEADTFDVSQEKFNDPKKQRQLELILFLITEVRQEEHDWLFNKFGDSDVSAREFEIIQHEASYRLKKKQESL